MQPSPLCLNHVQAVCLKMAAGAFTAGLFNSVVHTGYVSSLSFCSSKVIHHFFCDNPPLFKLSCTDTCLHESIFSTFAGVNMVGILLVIFASYSFILFSIFRMHSGEEMQSLLYTCVSPDSHHPVLQVDDWNSVSYISLLLASFFKQSSLGGDWNAGKGKKEFHDSYLLCTCQHHSRRGTYTLGKI